MPNTPRTSTKRLRCMSGADKPRYNSPLLTTQEEKLGPTPQSASQRLAEGNSVNPTNCPTASFYPVLTLKSALTIYGLLAPLLTIPHPALGTPKPSHFLDRPVFRESPTYLPLPHPVWRTAIPARICGGFFPERVLKPCRRRPLRCAPSRQNHYAIRRDRLTESLPDCTRTLGGGMAPQPSPASNTTNHN